MTDTEEIGDGGPFRDLYALTQDVDACGCRDRSRSRRQFTGDQFQKRRLADTIAADEPGPFGTENDIQIGEKRTTVRSGPGQIGEDNGMRHGQGFPVWQGKAALRSG
jgi:hypothetical protein